MASLVFDKILHDAARQGLVPAATKKSMNWFRTKAEMVTATKVRPSKFIADTARTYAAWGPGSMYMMVYDPKHKKTLPYYDKFPLILPYKRVPGGFYALNLHYLAPPQRAQLMQALFEDRLNNKKFDNTTKFKLGAQAYRILKAASRYRFFIPCLKHYLNDHVKSRFIYIHPSEWQIALFLPTHQFEKKAASTVWKDSRRKIKRSNW